jgi:hypothetical protein
VCYPPLAGGKFLMNCLGLHNNCVFQDKNLINISYDEKLKYLHDKLEQAKQKKIWNDLDLGCDKLFNIKLIDYFVRNKVFFKSLISPEVTQLSIDNNRFFFLVAHDIPSLKKYLKFWKNAKIIFFQNYHDFIKQRKKTKVINYWNQVKGADWPIDPPDSISNIKTLPKFVQHELNHQFNNKIRSILTPSPLLKIFDRQLKQVLKKLNPETYYFWDCNSYNSGELLINNLQKCYYWLNLTIHNEQDIIDYYTDWINTLDIVGSNYSSWHFDR